MEASLMLYAPPPWAPGPAEVAAFIGRLAGASAGTSSGTFDATTTPTADQVTAVIAGVAQELGHIATDDITQAWAAAPRSAGALAARRVIALGAASQVALSYFPTTQSQELAAVLEARYLAALARLLPGVAGADEAAGSSGGGSGDLTPATAVGAFPVPVYDYGTLRW